MPDNDQARPLRTATRCVRAGEAGNTAFHSIAVPIVQNNAFEYPDLDEWLEVATFRKPGHTYSRTTNPTVRAFEEKIADLEGAEDATACASGMGVISTTLFSLLKPGDVAVSVKDSYGATYLHFDKLLPRYGVQTRIIETSDHDALERAVLDGCKLVYLETPTNPTLKILDIARVVRAAKKVGALTIMDNTFATPINQQPIAMGVDLVLHSASKFLGGHSDVIGGVVCGRHELIHPIFEWRNLTGACMDPNTAYLLIRSMKTLHLRVAWQNESAMRIAQFLSSHPKVTLVNYPGLPGHLHHDIAARQMTGFGAVLSFAIEGDFGSIKRFMPLLRIPHSAPNLGQVDSVIGPPATTSHVECTPEERAAAGIPETLLRLSVGIEDPQDLIEDLEQALDRYDR